MGVDPTTDPDNTQMAKPNNYRLLTRHGSDWRLNDTLDGLIPTDTGQYAQVSNEARVENMTDAQRYARSCFGRLRSGTTGDYQGIEWQDHNNRSSVSY